MNKTILLVVALVFATCTQIFGQASAPKYSNEFLSIGVGARAFGMGNAQVGVVNDVTAGYWNPAGLASIGKKYEGALQHAEYFAGIAAYDYAGFATRIDSSSTLGVSFIRFAVDNIPDTRFLYDADGSIRYDRIKKFSASDNALLVSYAKKDLFIKGLQAGANFKVIHRNVGTFANSWGFGLDVGLQYNKAGWLLGAMVRDITGTFNAWAFNTVEMKHIADISGSEIPENSLEVTLPKLRAGLARQFRFKENKFGVLPAVDFDFTFDGKRNTVISTGYVSIDPFVGLELDYSRIVFLRGGVNTIQQVYNLDNKKQTSYQPNFGVGIKISNFYVDYALTNIGNSTESLYSHAFSLKAAF
jgi:hypothetical protein